MSLILFLICTGQINAKCFFLFYHNHNAKSINLSSIHNLPITIFSRKAENCKHLSEITIPCALEIICLLFHLLNPIQIYREACPCVAACANFDQQKHHQQTFIVEIRFCDPA